LKKTFLSAFFIISFAFSSFAQNVDSSIIGNWSVRLFSRVDSTVNKEDLLTGVGAFIITFKANNRYVTTKKIKKRSVFIGFGTYVLNVKKRFFIQDGNKFEVLSYSKKEILLKISERKNMLLARQ
jgi:hypothetical protein